MGIKAICVACGKPKRDPFKRCKSCGYLPETEYQLARALIFSSPSFARQENTGRDQATLKALSKQITGGRPYEFDPDEVEQALRAYKQITENNTAIKNRIRNTAKALIFLVIIIAGVLVYIYFKP